MTLGTELFNGFTNTDALALLWFLLCWIGYSVYAILASRKRQSLASILAEHRKAWILSLLKRENRVSDASLLSNLERNVSFFASSTLFILVGLVAVLGSGEKVMSVSARLPFNVGVSEHAWEAKLLILLVLFIYAFFKFTWSLRQYGFANVLMGRAPLLSEISAEQAETFSHETSLVISRAAYAYNYGLRSYYFGLAYLVWFLNPWAFMLAAAWVVVVLYRREFRSNVLKALVAAI
ncbi:MAG: DUF599 domain-containing protein [Pseudomonadales bacterium]|nr:DUF599 domain-containing protein [Pseudomonadales bacterium]